MINFLAHNWDKRYKGKDQGVMGLGRSLGNLLLVNGFEKASLRPNPEAWFRRMSGYQLAKGD